MEKLFAYLSFNGPLSAGLLQALRSYVKHATFKKKEHLLRAGQKGQYIYFITSGAVRTYSIKGCKEVSGWFLLEGDVQITIESFQHNEAAFQNVQAIKDTEVLYITYDELRHLIKNFPEFKDVFLERVLHYYALLARKYFQEDALPAEERYRAMITKHPEWLKQIPLKDLASFVGISVPYMIKLRNKIGGRGAVRSIL